MRNGKSLVLAGLSLVLALGSALRAAEGTIDRFAFPPSDIALSRTARPLAPFDKAGRAFAILGSESGTFEAWAYPLKILRGFELSFIIGSSTRPIAARDVVRSIEVTPAVTTVTYVFQSFTIRASFVAAARDPGAVVLLAVDAVEPVTIVCGFLPVLQPMWPAGLGGQYASWDDELKAYLISEPRRLNHGFVGSPAGEGISYTPAHMLSDAPSEFKIVVADPRAVRDKFIPIILAGGQGDREAVKAVYRKLASDPRAVCEEAERHFAELRRSTLRVSTPDRELDLAFEWAKVAYDGLLVDNPDLGRGLVAGLGASGSGGRPGFGWFFGTDACFNSLSLNSYGEFATTRSALAFLEKRQRPDGKMMHELSQAAGRVDWFKDYPYAYIHADTTPYFIVAVGDYVRKSGDVAFLKESWPSLRKAFDYCLAADANGDGLMDNSRAGLGALEFGSLTGIETDIYLAAVWVQACRAMGEEALLVGDKAAADKAERAFERAARAYDDKFWDEASGQYSYGFNAGGSRVAEITPWSAVGGLWGLGRPERVRRTLERLNRSDMTADWGIRMMSTASRSYDPLSYNYGACWPFLAGYAAAALFLDDQAVQGFGLLKATARHTFDNQLGTVTELFSGFTNVWPQEAVPHQGFSSGGVVLPLVRGLLGLETNALENEIAFSPRLPGNWPGITIENLKVGTRTVGLRLERTPERLTLEVRGAGLQGLRMIFRPLLAGCRGVGTARLDGREIALVSEGSAYPIRPEARFGLTGQDTLVLTLEPEVDVLPAEQGVETGATDRGLKIVSLQRRGNKLVVAVEGLSGRVYDLPLVNPDRVLSVENAALDGGRLRIAFPRAATESYVFREVVIVSK
jgi:glycogen debranching enzyme